MCHSHIICSSPVALFVHSVPSLHFSSFSSSALCLHNCPRAVGGLLGFVLLNAGNEQPTICSCKFLQHLTCSSLPLCHFHLFIFVLNPLLSCHRLFLINSKYAYILWRIRIPIFKWFLFFLESVYCFEARWIQVCGGVFLCLPICTQGPTVLEEVCQRGSRRSVLIKSGSKGPNELGDWAQYWACFTRKLQLPTLPRDNQSIPHGFLGPGPLKARRHRGRSIHSEACDHAGECQSMKRIKLNEGHIFVPKNLGNGLTTGPSASPET